MELNKQQIKAVEHFAGPCLVTAVPGSGKTSTITERVIRLIEKGISPSNILCLTFTNKAANEMKQRICKKLQTDKIDSFIGTFHSFAAYILRQYSSHIGYKSNITIIDDKEQLDIIYKVARRLGRDKKEDNIDGELIANIINQEREKIKTIEEIAEKFYNTIFQEISIEYFKELKEQNIIDFSGLLYETYQLLNNNKNILEKLQDKYKFILIDEIQDTNLIQFKIISSIGDKHKNIFIVGDIDQTIYLWRGSRYQNVLDFIKEHQNCVQIELGENYRSTPQIIEVAHNLIKHNKDRIGKVFETKNPSGSKVVCQNFYSSTEESQYVANKIKYFINEEGYDPTDIAVLYRLNKISMELQIALTNAHIPFVVVGGFSFFDRKEIKDCIAMLRFIHNYKDSLSFHKIMSFLGGIGDVSIGKIETISKNENIDLLLACKNAINSINRASARKSIQKFIDVFSEDYLSMSAGDCLFNLVSKIGYFDRLKTIKLDDAQDRIDNVNELIVNATESKNSVEDYLQSISLITSADSDDKAGVCLSSIHAAKGKEWDLGILVSVNHGILPHGRSILEAKTLEEKRNWLEEETRIAFVAMTRFRKSLTVCYCNSRKYRDKSGMLRYKEDYPSQFLFESGLLKDKSKIKEGIYFTR